MWLLLGITILVLVLLAWLTHDPDNMDYRGREERAAFAARERRIRTARFS
ncbi:MULTISPECIES: hypothetical protein [Gordonia]|jgi:hypothetical protein